MSTTGWFNIYFSWLLLYCNGNEVQSFQLCYSRKPKTLYDAL